MGAAQDFFFVRESIFSKKNYGQGSHYASMFFLFWWAHFLKKKIMGKILIEFVIISICSQPIVVINVHQVAI